MRSLRTASCAAATELVRPTVIGVITPGKSTVLRIGITMSASAGSGFDAVALPAVAPAALGRSWLSLDSTLVFMRLPSCET